MANRTVVELATPPAAGPWKQLGELAQLFLKLGITAFGGPAAHIALNPVGDGEAGFDDDRPYD